jgi:hypothetical protein
MRRVFLSFFAALATLMALPGAAQEAASPPAVAAVTPRAVAGGVHGVALSDVTLGEARGGLATPLGVDIGFGASVRTYVDGALALETRLTWTADGARSNRIFESDAARRLTAEQMGAGERGQVRIAPGTSVVHDLTENRIASVVLNSANDRTIRQDTDVSLHLPHLPDLQQRISTERMTQALQALSPQASGLAK